MARADVEYVVATDLLREPLAGFGLPFGWQGARLSFDTESGAATYLVHVAPHWIAPDALAIACGFELFMLAGDMHVGPHRLARGHYACAAAGSMFGPASSDRGCTFILMTASEWIGPPAGFDESAWRVIDTLAMPWQASPDFEGRTAAETPPGVHVKWLREEGQGGAYTMLVHQTGGWSDPALEAHRCWEELLLIEGDYLMGRNGEVPAGCYIFRNGEIPHGPQATRAGSVWFCRGDRRIDFQYTPADWAPSQIERYLGASGAGSEQDRPWGDWRGTITHSQAED
jgi:hypothetical protein